MRDVVSHRQLNLVDRDVTEQFEHIASLVTIDTAWHDNDLQCVFNLGYPLPPEFRPWKDAWGYGEAHDLESATSMIFAAVAASASNPNRDGGDWFWYVCPKCDFHSIVYQTPCQNCSTDLPSERKMHLVGLIVALTIDAVFPKSFMYFGRTPSCSDAKFVLNKFRPSKNEFADNLNE